MGRKKILMVTTVAVTLEAFLLPHAEKLKKNGFQVDCLARGADSSGLCRSAFDHCYGINWTRSPFDLRNFTEYPSFVKNLVEREAYSIVHVHTPVASFVTRWALRNLRLRKGIKVIYTAHGFHFHKGGNPVKNAVFLGLEKAASSWTDELQVMNSEDYEAALKYLMPKERVRFLKDGVGLDRTYYSKDSVSKEEIESARGSLGLKASDILFTMTGEFNKGKRHRDLINALSLIRDRKVHLAFLGSGKLMDQCKAQVRALGLQQRVHFLGQVKDVRPYMLASAATVLPSEREGLPRCVMESLALGVPVIGADARGTRDLLKNGRGRLFPVGDVKELSRALAMAIESQKTSPQTTRRGTTRS